MEAMINDYRRPSVDFTKAHVLDNHHWDQLPKFNNNKLNLFCKILIINMQKLMNMAYRMNRKMIVEFLIFFIKRFIIYVDISQMKSIRKYNKRQVLPVIFKVTLFREILGEWVH